MIRRVVDFALGNRLLVLGLALVLFVLLIPREADRFSLDGLLKQR